MNLSRNIRLTLILTASGTLNMQAQDRPNVVFFIVDDMGLMDTSVPFDADTKGNPIRHELNDWYHTPAMERLAAQGTRFSTFYAQSVSSPSRSSVMTGQNAARHRTTNWINAESDNRDRYGPYDWNWAGLKRTDMIYPRVLHEAGYKAIHVGKAHFANMYAEGVDPCNLGFDVNIAGSAIGQPGSYYGENAYGWTGGNRSRAVPGLEKYHGTPTFLTDALTLEAQEQIRQAVKEGRPFYLNLSHYAVHQPFETDRRFLCHYPEGKMSDAQRAFSTLIEGQDKSLGDLLDFLGSIGVAENTLVIFMGDNGSDAPLGDKFGYGSSAPFRGKKGTEYEGGMRVPFIIAWAKPDAGNKFQKAYPVKQGYVQPQMATEMDIYPTVLSVAGVEKPEGHILDGADLKKLVAGKRDRRHRDDWLMHFPHENNGRYHTVYRKGDWKLIYYYHPEKPGRPEYKLYNLADDPYEHHDLAAERPKRLGRMFRLMKKRMEMENAALPVDGDGNRLELMAPNGFN